VNIAHKLDKAAEQNAGKIAIHFEDHSMTYAELQDATARFAGGLRDMGIVPGDRIAVYMPNLPQFVVAIWGAFKAGVVPTPMNPQLRRREIAHQLKDSGAKAIFALVHNIAEVEGAVEDVGDVKIIGVGGPSDHPRFREMLGQPHFVECDDNDAALQPYTSGTTGNPKGVVLTHKNLSSNVDVILDLLKIPADAHRMLVPLPMFHITGMTVMMLTPLSQGATIYPMLRWDAEETMSLIQEHQINSMVGVPTLFIDMMNNPKCDDYDLSSLKVCSSGGAKLPEPILAAFENKFGVTMFEGYGLTETSPVTHSNLAAPAPKPGSIGAAVEGCETRIVDEDGKDVAIGEVGELLIRGPMVMQGYFNNPEATAASIQDGWFHTGDLARTDDAGYFYIVDRKKDMVLTGGYNVYPKEVENILFEHPAVADCAVLGVPDERKGETVKACIVLKPGNEAGDELSENIRQHCLNELAAYKHPRQIEFVDALPRTGSGKVQKFKLK
jgi:long-chain acyl-CoA synthetase